MRIAVCYNQTPDTVKHGDACDLIADAGSCDEANAVFQALIVLKHQPELVALGNQLTPFVDKLHQLQPDLVFNLCEGFWGDARQEMNVAGIYELLRLPYTGSKSLCLGLSQDKLYTKALLQQKGLPTPAFALARVGEKFAQPEALKFPMIVKPPYEDASQGISCDSVVENRHALHKRINYIHEVYQQPALVEEYIDGRELNVAVLGDVSPSVLPLSEITFAAELPRAIVCFDSKWTPESAAYRGTKPVCPAVLAPKETLLVNMIAIRAYKLLGCRDYARVDIRLRNQTPYILEVNANPDISPDAGLARSAKAAGLSYPQLIERIVAAAIQRKERSNAHIATH